MSLSQGNADAMRFSAFSREGEIVERLGQAGIWLNGFNATLSGWSAPPREVLRLRDLFLGGLTDARQVH